MRRILILFLTSYLSPLIRSLGRRTMGMGRIPIPCSMMSSLTRIF